MPIRKTVRRGDSLWSLAFRYLDSGARYPQILDFHNQEAHHYGLRQINEADLIFVGETILIPPRPKLPEPGTGTKAEGSRPPFLPDLKVTFTIGRDTPPIIYATYYGEYDIITEMSGDIGLVNRTPGHRKYVHNYELAMSKDSMQAKQKLHNVYDPAVAALTAKPEMVFESGKVKIKAPIAAKANIGAYDVEVQNVTPLHMSGTLKPQIVSGTLELGRFKFKYSADIEFKVDVFLHPRPKRGPEPVRVGAPESKAAAGIGENSLDLRQIAVSVTWTIVGTALLILGYRYAHSLKGATSMQPFLYTIDPKNPRNLRYFNNNA